MAYLTRMAFVKVCQASVGDKASLLDYSMLRKRFHIQFEKLQIYPFKSNRNIDPHLPLLRYFSI